MSESPPVAPKPNASQQLAESREIYWRDPDFFALEANLRYQSWLGSDRIHFDPQGVFPAIEAGQFLPRGAQYHGQEHWFQPGIGEEELHRKCIKYCRRSASYFVSHATSIAAVIAGDVTGVDAEYIRGAFDCLVGDSIGGEVTTVLKPGSPGGNAYGQPWDLDYRRLEVEVGETEVPEEKIMAGIGLTMALWVRLADEGSSRTQLGHSFEDPLKGQRFWSLLMSSGWGNHAGIDLLPALALAHAGSLEEKDLFLDHFRTPEFFENTVAVLKSD